MTAILAPIGTQMCSASGPSHATVGESLVAAILDGAQAGCRAYSVLALPPLPTGDALSDMLAEPRRLCVPRLPAADRRPPAVEGDVWTILAVRDPDAVLGAVARAWASRSGTAQLRALAAAALADVCAQLSPAIGESLAVADARRAVSTGRKLWRELGAWPWAVASPDGLHGEHPTWLEEQVVRAAWRRWRAGTHWRERLPEAGWAPMVDALDPAGARRRPPRIRASRRAAAPGAQPQRPRPCRCERPSPDGDGQCLACGRALP